MHAACSSLARKPFRQPRANRSYDEGALCTPVVHLVNVSFDEVYECLPAALWDDQEAWFPTWINIGAANGCVGIVTGSGPGVGRCLKRRRPQLVSLS